MLVLPPGWCPLFKIVEKDARPLLTAEKILLAFKAYCGGESLYFSNMKSCNLERLVYLTIYVGEIFFFFGDIGKLKIHGINC